MTNVVTITIGARTYSVYTTGTDALADANDYMVGRFGTTAWDAANNNDKKKALVSAVRFIDRAVIWSGVQTDLVTPQPLQWPRDSAFCGSESVPDGTTPDPFATATYEMALILLVDSTVQSGTGTGSNVKKVKAGSAEVEFFTGTAGTSEETRLPTVVNDLIGCFIGDDLSFGSLSSGTDPDDNKSTFDCDDQYNRTRGYP